MYNHPKILLAIDCLVFGYDPENGNLKVLLFKRPVQPNKGKWSLIGGFVRLDEDISAAANRVLEEFTGLRDVFLEQLSAYGKTDRDPGGRVVSILYWSLIKLEKLQNESALKNGATWFDFEDCPELVFDHHQMFQEGIENLRSKAKNQPIGFELLPEEFTIPQMKQLYDSIYDLELDDRNFRKKILSTNLLLNTDKKDKSTSRKGAYIYRFNTEKYEELRKTGYHLDLNI